MKPSFLAALVPLFVVVACGGNVFDGNGESNDGGGAEDGGGGGDGDGGGKVGPGCPSSRPNDGVACLPEGLHCEYGTNNGACGNPTTDCTNGAWKQPPPVPGVPCLPSDACPALRSSIVTGQGCGDEDLECNYPGQGRCTCAEEGLGGGQPYNPDGGPLPKVWECEQPTPGCPIDRPRLGTTCVPQGGVSLCFYGDCSMPDSLDIECVDGIWVNEPFACGG